MTDIRSRCFYEISSDTRSIVYRSLDRLATEYRPTLDRLSTNSQPTLDCLSTDCPPTIDRLSTDYRSTIDRLSIDSRPTIDRLSIDYQPTIDRLSTDIAVDIAVDTMSTLPAVNMIHIFTTRMDFDSVLLFAPTQ